MKSPFLLPHWFKAVGVLLLLVFCVLFLIFQFEIFPTTFFEKVPVFAIWDNGILNKGDKEFFYFTPKDLQFEILISLAIIGLLFVSFSKQRYEDEFVMKIRLDALIWATYTHYIILVISLFTIYGLGFMYAIIANMFALLLIFILRFHYLIFVDAKTLQNEE